jgi:hypothetical protein
VDVTTHLRARTAQAGAFLALVTGLVAGIPTAAQAVAPTVKIDSVSDRTVSSGSTVTISYTVSNPEGEANPGRFDTDVTTSAGRCSNGCSPGDTIGGEPKKYDATLTAPTVAAGQTQTMTITVTSKDEDEAAATATETITVEGPAAPTTVRQVSGRIKDDAGDRVPGVQVVMKDSQGHTYTSTTDSTGGYSFNSSDAQPIAAGSIQVAAAKAGYEAADVTVQGAAGRTVTVPLTIKKTAAATSATPSASASATTAPTDEATEDEEGAEEGTNGINDIGGDNAQEASNNTDDGGSSWLLIVMGGVLVAAGIGVMVLVLMRRKKAEELSSDTGLGQAVPAGVGGGFDATRVAAPVGAGRGGDATMIAPAAGMGVRPAGMGGGISDAPTMVHRTPVEDEFPDPYGAPLPPGGGYAGGNQWDDQQGGAYGGGGNYGATQTYGQQGGAYGAAQGGTGGYNDGGGAQQRYDEHTNLYQPEPGGANYGGQAGGYDQGGYDQAGYDQAGYEQGGYDQGWSGQDAGGYGPQGGYDQQQGGNYGGYDQGGYDQQQGGYPQQGGNYGGYDQQQGGAGYPQQQPPQQQPPQQGGGTYGGQQRPNRDWMDD